MTALYTLVNKLGSNLSFWATDVLLAEQELTVQVRQINGVHVYHVKVCEAHQSQILQQFTPQPSSSCQKKCSSIVCADSTEGLTFKQLNALHDQKITKQNSSMNAEQNNNVGGNEKKKLSTHWFKINTFCTVQ